MRISKNILFRTVPFDASDCHALELYLSEMAAKGWMLDEIWILNIFKFKRCEPKNMRFTVDIPKLSDTCADTSLQNYELLFNEYIDIIPILFIVFTFVIINTCKLVRNFLCNM